MLWVALDFHWRMSELELWRYRMFNTPTGGCGFTLLCDFHPQLIASCRKERQALRNNRRNAMRLTWGNKCQVGEERLQSLVWDSSWVWLKRWVYGICVDNDSRWQEWGGRDWVGGNWFCSRKYLIWLNTCRALLRKRGMGVAYGYKQECSGWKHRLNLKITKIIRYQCSHCISSGGGCGKRYSVSEHVDESGGELRFVAKEVEVLAGVGYNFCEIGVLDSDLGAAGDCWAILS